MNDSNQSIRIIQIIRRGLGRLALLHDATALILHRLLLVIRVAEVYRVRLAALGKLTGFGGVYV